MRGTQAVGALLVAVVVTGCGAEVATPVASGNRGGDVSRAAVRPAGDGWEEALPSGTLRADPGTGCLWLEDENGEPGPQLLLYGEDYRVDFSQSPPAVLDRDAVVARAGDEVEVGGGFTAQPDGVEGCPANSDSVFLGYFPGA